MRNTKGRNKNLTIKSGNKAQEDCVNEKHFKCLLRKKKLKNVKK